MAQQRTTCAIVGGGPAGIVLGLVLARAGVEVTVLEKHGDFLRDFRGDTVHVSTMTLIDELGLWDRFAELPWKPIEQARVVLDAGPATVADLSAAPRPAPVHRDGPAVAPARHARRGRRGGADVHARCATPR